MFRKLKLATKINMIVLSFIIVLAMIMSYVMMNQVESGAQQAAIEKVRTDLPLGYEFIDAKYPGDWLVKNGELYKGNVKISANFDLVDEVAEMTNGTVTIFLGDTRVATNVFLEGQRAVGTQVSKEVANAVLVEGETYYGVANVVGNTYQTGYRPIYDANGETVGIWYVGASQSFIDETIQETMKIFLFILVIAIVIVVLLLLWYTRRITKRLGNINEVMNAAGKGDFTKEVEVDAEDEIGHLINSFNSMKNNLNKLIVDVIKTSDDVATSSQTLTINSEQTSQATEQISVAIQEVTFGTEKQMGSAQEASEIAGEISLGMNQIAANIQNVTDASVQMHHSAIEGNEVVHNAVKQMNLINTRTEESSKVVDHLSSKTNEINHIIGLITDVSDQTNLLALNAAIEAARAGEQGKGFAVVADEVRKLAEQSGKSAQKVKSLILEIQDETKKAVLAMNDSGGAVKEGITIINEAGQTFEMITDSVKHVASQLEEVAASVEQSTSGIDKMVSMTNKVKEITEQSAEYMQNVAASTEEQTASMQEVAASAAKLTSISEQLRQSVKVFNV